MDQLDEWIEDVLTEGGEIRGFLMLQGCWKCAAEGWAFFLEAPYSRMVTKTASTHKYAGIRRQLREYMDAHPEIAAKFGTVRIRTSRQRQSDYLSHGCHACDVLWGDDPLEKLCMEYFREWGGNFPDDVNEPTLKHIFTVDIDRLFDET